MSEIKNYWAIDSPDRDVLIQELQVEIDNQCVEACAGKDIFAQAAHAKHIFNKELMALITERQKFYATEQINLNKFQIHLHVNNEEELMKNLAIAMAENAKQLNGESAVTTEGEVDTSPPTLRRMVPLHNPDTVQTNTPSSPSVSDTTQQNNETSSLTPQTENTSVRKTTTSSVNDGQRPGPSRLARSTTNKNDVNSTPPDVKVKIEPEVEIIGVHIKSRKKHTTKRQRGKNFNPEQLKSLRKYHRICNKPTTELLADLAKQFKVTTTRLRSWFRTQTLKQLAARRY